MGSYSYYGGSPRFGVRIGYGEGELLPGLYEYRRAGDNRVENENCSIALNISSAKLPYGEPFTFRFFTYHETVTFYGCSGALYRIGD